MSRMQMRTRTSHMAFARMIVATLPVSASALLPCGLARSADAATIYVDDSAPAGGNGQSWATAYRFLSDALAGAAAGDEIRIGQGVQRPDRSASAPSGSGDRAATFDLVNDITLNGGYAGFGASDPDARDPDVFLSILSGDLLGDDGPAGANTADNALHVITASGVNAGAVVDGVHIRDGFADGTPSAFHRYGAGVLALGGGPTFRRCRFLDNRAEHTGGAVYAEDGDPVFEECVFEGNLATFGAGVALLRGNARFSACTFTGNSTLQTWGEGAAITARLSRDVDIIECEFTDNTAVYAAVHFSFSGGSIIGSTFHDNHGGVSGGAYLTSSSPLIDACVFSQNFGSEGGAIGFFQSSHPRVVHCAFTGNVAGGSASNGGAVHTDTGSGPTFVNCDFIDNTAARGSAASHDGTLSPVGHPYFWQCRFIGNGEGEGALYNAFGRPVVLECEFRDNIGSFGGAIRSMGGVPVVAGCLFDNNYAFFRGGAVHNSTGSHARISNCTFLDNRADDEGGAIWNTESDAVVAACDFRGNSAANRGGAMLNDRSDVQCLSSAFIANTAPQGGAIDNFDFSDGHIGNCSFVNNVAASGAVLRSANSACTVSNSIAWFNGASAIVAASGTITLNRCNTQTAWGGPGSGNFSANPMFVNVDPGAGAIDVALLPGSPCIDAAITPADAGCRLDLLGQTRAVDDPATVDTGTGAGGSGPVADLGAIEFASRAGFDCNRNAVPDACDIASGEALDCNRNGVPDFCDAVVGDDCNFNRIPDECETDCNRNGVPDDCDIQSGASLDCNDNGVPDDCEIDCDGNGIPDQCDLAGGAPDCNNNDILDSCDIASGASLDCDLNGVPDECQPDCNDNNIADVCDIASGFSQDLNGNGVPDECDPDCNGDGVPDFVEIAAGASDCNRNLVPDECDIAGGWENDCNANGQIDWCELAALMVNDCNNNGVPDLCDVLAVPMTQYVLADSFPESLLGNPASQGGGMIWLNQFAVVAGGEVINAIRLPIGFVEIGAPFDVCLWSDPNGDGDPTDAQLLAAVATNSWVPALLPGATIPLPPTYIGPAGTSFFAGAHMAHPTGIRPACLDRTTPHQHRSWFAYGSNLVNLAANPTPPANIDTIMQGDWLISARSGSGIDINGNGVPDFCPECAADIVPPGNVDGIVDINDLLAVISAWGACPALPAPCPADIVPGGASADVIDIDDLLAVISAWGECP